MSDLLRDKDFALSGRAGELVGSLALYLHADCSAVGLSVTPTKPPNVTINGFNISLEIASYKRKLIVFSSSTGHCIPLS